MTHNEGDEMTSEREWLREDAPRYHLCCVCGTVSAERDWTYWQANMDEATEEETPLVPSKPGESDPVCVCPACKWHHRDTEDGSGFYEGTLAEMEAQRAEDEPEYGEWWAEALREAATTTSA